MESRVTPPKRDTTPTWGSPAPCKQPLKVAQRVEKFLDIHFTQQTSYTLLQTALAQFYFGQKYYGS